jgi:23S rRNA (guanine745-N1)-methyltransferase
VRVGPWRCPVCGRELALYDEPPEPRRWACSDGHSFDVARHGYVNLLPTGRGRREHGDAKEMVAARRLFLDGGSYDPISAAVTRIVGGLTAKPDPGLILDIGCGEGHYTRRLAPPAGWLVAGVDVARSAVGLAARAHPAGCYAVASAADLPLADGAVDVAVLVFGPVFPAELARAVRPGGAVVAVHPGPRHLESLRALVYAEPRPHEVKPPLRMAPEEFEGVGGETVTFPVVVRDVARLQALFTMTPYRWHAPTDIAARLDAAAAAGFETQADVVVTTYRRR